MYTIRTRYNLKNRVKNKDYYSCDLFRLEKGNFV